MKKAKYLLLILILALVLCTATGCLSVLGLLFGGGGSGNDASPQPQEVIPTPAPQDNSPVEYSIQEQLPQAPVPTPARDVSGNKALGQNVAEMIYQRASYQVTWSDGATCTVLVTAPDMKTLFEETPTVAVDATQDPDAADREEQIFLATLADRLERGDYPILQTQLTMEMEYGEPVLTYEFVDAMYGGMLTVWEELVASAEVG